jgi:hypothetical protein
MLQKCQHNPHPGPVISSSLQVKKKMQGGHCALRPKRAGLVGWTLKKSESRNRCAKCPEEPVSLRALPEPSRPSRVKLEMLHCYSLE